MGPWWAWLVIFVGGNVLIAVLLVLWIALMNLLTDRPGRGSGRVERSGAEPISFRFELEAEKRPDLKEIATALLDLGLKPVADSGSTADLVLVGGSELRGRMGGGYSWGDITLLPNRVELNVLQDGSSTPKLELLISENYRGPVLWREKMMEERYAMLAAEIRSTVESQLTSEAPDSEPPRGFHWSS